MQRTRWMNTVVSVALSGVVAAAPGISGCATMAHKVKPNGLHMRKTEKCEGLNKICPWLIADFAWLFAGVVPGVVALIVDFGTGAWDHENLVDSTETSTRSEARASVQAWSGRIGERFDRRQAGPTAP